MSISQIQVRSNGQKWKISEIYSMHQLVLFMPTVKCWNDLTNLNKLVEIFTLCSNFNSNHLLTHKHTPPPVYSP